MLGVLVFSLFGLTAMAQQDPYFTHFMFNKLVYNPAYAGTRDAICANLVFHNQWWTFSEGGGAPVTESFNVHAPITLMQQHKLGVGLNVVNDASAYMSMLNATVALDYRYTTPYGELSAGLSAGIVQRSLDGDELEPIDQGDVLLQGILGRQVGGLSTDFGLGVYLDNEDYYVGLSALHLFQSDINMTTTLDFNNARSYYLMGGYTYAMNSLWDIQPNALLKMQGGVWQADLSAIALYQEKYWGGLNYRFGDAIALMLGMYINDNLRVGYSHDVSTSELLQYLGTSEFFVNYCFNIEIRQPTERRWNTRHL